MTATDQTNLGMPTVADGVLLTDVAASKVKALLDSEGRDDLALRVAVQPGGCSGLRYQLFFDERSLDGDQLHDFAGVGVVVDRMSAPYLLGATIDFVDTIEKQGFTIDNPAGRPPPTRHNGWIDGGSRLPRPSGTIRCHTAGQSLPGGRSW